MRARSNSEPQDNNVSTLLLEYLKAENVEILFGIPGVALGPLLNELREQQETFRYVICRHEGSAAYIADGYARLSGKLGVVLVTTGPGATNAFTGAMTAQCGGSSVLVISAEVPQSQWGLGALQEGIYASLDIDQVYRGGLEYSAVPTQAANVPTLLTQAIRDAMARPRRAAHISFSQDLLSTAVTTSAPKHWRAYRAAPANCSDEKQARAALEMLAHAKRPLVMIGNGTREGLSTSPERRARFLELLEHFGIPWFTTSDGKGILPETHELSLGSYGLGISVWPYEYMTMPGYAPYDAVLVLGSSLQQNATSPTIPTPSGNSVTPFNPCLIPQGPFVQVDLDSSVIGRVFPLEMGIVAEAGAFIDDLIAASAHVHVDKRTRAERLELVKTIKTTTAVPPPQLEGKMLQALSAALPAGSHVFVDASTAAQLSQTYMTIDPPTCMHNSLGQAPMGWGLGAAIGGKFAQPQSVCIALLGDGVLLMHGTELSTAAAHGLGVIFLVIHNGVLGTVVNKMKSTYGPGDWAKLYSIGTPQLMQFAKSLGAEAARAATPDELVKEFEAAVKRSERGIPQVLIAETPIQLSGSKENT
jgi:acetolactate synthase I/II/III large subunit